MLSTVYVSVLRESYGRGEILIECDKNAGNDLLGYFDGQTIRKFHIIFLPYKQIEVYLNALLSVEVLFVIIRQLSFLCPSSWRHGSGDENFTREAMQNRVYQVSWTQQLEADQRKLS